MSLYSITESNICRPINSKYHGLNKLTKLNKFYSKKLKLFPKYNKDQLSTINIRNNHCLCISNNTTHFTPIKMCKTNTEITLFNSNSFNTSIKSYKDFNNIPNMTIKIKSKYNPEILDTKYISRPNRHKKKLSNLNMPKYNSFLGTKTKNKCINFKTFNIINPNNLKFLSTVCGNKPKINKSIKDDILIHKYGLKRNDSINYSMKYLIERAHRSRKKAALNMINEFKLRLALDKRENLNEFNKYMNELQVNLNLSRSKSKPKKNFIY